MCRVFRGTITGINKKLGPGIDTRWFGGYARDLGHTELAALLNVILTAAHRGLARPKPRPGLFRPGRRAPAATIG
jgi:hypothetical protein